MKTQAQLFYDAESRSGRLNAAFFEMVSHPTNPLTDADLTRLIERRPETYARFAGFVGKLDAARIEREADK